MRTEVIWQSWREVGLLPHQVLDLEEDAQRAHLLALHVGLRADDVRLARGQHAQGMKPPADAKAVWEIGSAIEDGAGWHPPDAEAGGDRAPPDQLPHQARRAHLRTLLRALARP